MRLSTVFASLVVLTGLFTTETQAQPVDMFLTATCDGTDIIVNLTVEVTPLMNPAVAGFDVFYRRNGDCDRTLIRLNEDVLPRGADGHHGFQLTHSTDFEGNLYRYEALPVDADRNPMEITDIGIFDILLNVDYDTCSSTPPIIGIGFIAPSFITYIDPCPGSCWEEHALDWSFPFPPCDQFIGSSEPMVAYFGGYSGVGIEGPAFFPIDCQPATCTVPTEMKNWGAVKARFE